MKMKNKRLLVLGGNQYQIPLIEYARSKNIVVGLVDINENAPAKKYADYFYNVSLKDKEEVLKVVNIFRPDGITVGTVETAVLTCAYVADKCGLKGLGSKTAIRSTNKYEMIKTFKEHNVPCPDFQFISKDEINDAKCKIAYPVIVKPCDMSGSRGILLANNDGEFIEAIKKSSSISNSGDVIVEEYMNGKEVSVELIIKDGVAHAIQVTDKITSGFPHFIELGHIQPSRLDKNIIEDVKDVACSAAESLGLINGLGHAEIKITKDGPKMVEIGARQGGGEIGTRMVELSTGVNFNKIAIDIAFGNEIELPKIIDNKATCIHFITTSEGILSKVDGIEKARNEKDIYEVYFDGIIGNKYHDFKDNTDRLGYVLSYADNADDALKACDKALKDILVMYR